MSSKAPNLRRRYCFIMCDFTVTSWITVIVIVQASIVISQWSPIVYNVTEKQPPNTIVGNLANDIGVSVTTSGSVSTHLVMLNNSDPNQQLLRIDTSGLLRTAYIINRDVICPGRSHCMVMFDVAIVSGSGLSPLAGVFRIVKVQINVLNLNDFVPVFMGFPETVLYHISESTAVGVLFPLPVAIDNDSPANGIVGYRLNPASDSFNISQTIVTGGGETPLIFDVRLLLTKSLDRQRQDSYVFELIAFDGGVPSLSGSIQVQIMVDAAIDLSTAKFDKSVYSVTVNDDVISGALVVQVHAVIPSLPSSNGIVKYSFSSRSRTIYGHLFSIDSTSGDVTLSSGGGRALSEPVYNLSVEAINSLSPNSVPGIAAMFVTVFQVNDQSPTIIVDPMTDQGQPEVMAASPSGTFVAFLTVTDPDRGSNGQVSCSVSTVDGADSMHFSIQEIVAGYFKLLTTTVLYGGEYQLTVTCNDHGSPSHSAQADVNVTVVNPIVPVFSQPAYNGHVIDGNAAGSFVVRITANNSFSTNLSQIIYSIDSNATFRIDPESGVIWTQVALRLSGVSQTHVVLVKARNAYNLTSTAIVRVTVIPPSQVTFFDRTLLCTKPSTSAVTQSVLCTLGDLDSRLSPGNVAYYAVVQAPSMSNGSNTLQIDPMFGTILLVDSSSSNTVTYQLTVKVELSSVPVQYIYVIVIVEVKPSKPVTPPRFVFPSPKNNTVFVAADNWTSKTMIGGVFVTVISATSDVQDVNLVMTYSLVANDSYVTTCFVVVRDSGEVLFKDGTVGEAVINRTFQLFVVAFLSNHSDRQVVSSLNVIVAGWHQQVSAVVATLSSTSSGSSSSVVSILGSCAALVLFVLICAVLVCLVKTRRKKTGKKADQTSNGETLWVGIQSSSSPSPSYSSVDDTLPVTSSNVADNDSGKFRFGVDDATYLERRRQSVDGERHAIGANCSPVSGSSPTGTDDDSGCAAMSNNSSCSDDANDWKRSTTNSDFTGSFTKQDSNFTSTALNLKSFASNSPVVPDWITTTDINRRPEVILMPHQSAAILRRQGSTCSRKSVRFADDDDDCEEPKMDSIGDPKKHVRFATDRNLSYLYPCAASEVMSATGDYDSCNRCEDLEDMSCSLSDSSSGLYVLNRPNSYIVRDKQSLVGFTTFLPTDGSLV